MNQIKLDWLKGWFDNFVQPFLETDADGLKNILLKVEHTRKVCDVMEMITTGEGLSDHERCIAGAVALLHDVGRFPQYRRWRTFRDRDSDNHARMSIEVIRENRLLEDISANDRLMIEEAVRFHNLLRIPPRLQSPGGVFLRLIRDADKLDIWRVFLTYFDAPEYERASAALLGFPELPTVSDVCLAALTNRQVVKLDDITCANDFKLLLISWAFDLNFKASFRMIQKQGYLQALAATLPDMPETRRAVMIAVSHANESCE